jgi:hypothetical protein
MKALGSRPVLCIGSGWQNYGIPEQLVAWGPLLNIIYNLGQVCVNIHGASQVQGADRQLDLNNRVFDLAMAGCCQVCDNPEAIRQCFGDDEVVAVREPKEWVEWVLFMLDRHIEAESYRQKALQRALRDHTWQRRATKFLEIAEPLFAQWQPDRDWDLKPPVMVVFAEGKRRMKMAFSGLTKR